MTSPSLVLIQRLALEDKSVLELFHYIGKKFQASVAMDVSQFTDTAQLKATIEDFRVRGVAMLA